MLPLEPLGHTHLSPRCLTYSGPYPAGSCSPSGVGMSGFGGRPADHHAAELTWPREVRSRRLRRGVPSSAFARLHLGQRPAMEQAQRGQRRTLLGGRRWRQGPSGLPVAAHCGALPVMWLSFARSARSQSAVVGRKDSEVLQRVEIVVAGDLPDTLVTPLAIDPGSHPHALLVLHVGGHGQPWLARLDPLFWMPGTGHRGSATGCIVECRPRDRRVERPSRAAQLARVTQGRRAACAELIAAAPRVRV